MTKSEREIRELIKRFETPKRRKENKDAMKELYLKQTDRNYKDGDRN